MPHEIADIATVEAIGGKPVPEQYRPTVVSVRVSEPGQPDRFKDVVFSAGTLRTTGTRIAKNARGEWKRKDGTFYTPDPNGKTHPPLSEFEIETFAVDPLAVIEETVSRALARGVRLSAKPDSRLQRGESDPHGILSAPTVAAKRREAADKQRADAERGRSAK